MKAFCITLDRSNALRAQTALREIQRLGLEAEFADGVNVKLKPLSDLKALISPRAYVELQRGRQVHEALSGLGSVGCYLAHLALWRRCAEGSEPIAVFEDDVLFQHDAPQRFQALMQEAEANNYDIVRLIYSERGGQAVSPLLQRVTNRGWSTAAYVMKPKAARLIVQHALPMEMHPDYYLDSIAQKHSLNQYCPTVPLHIDRNLQSTIGHSELVGKKCTGVCSNWGWLIGACLLAMILLMVSLS